MRKVLFWMHLIAGVVAGIVVLIMSVTGVLLTYEKQMIAWADTRNLQVASSSGAQKLPVEALLSKARDARGALPSAIQMQSDPAKPVQMTFGQAVTYFDPYTGTLLGEGDKGIRQFFRSTTDWHRWLAASGESRAFGRSVTGYSNLVFLFIVVSGAYLWLPRVWSKASVMAITLFRPGLSGKARDFNWHNVIGIWSLVPLFFVVLSATVISFPWASNLVYTLTGSPVPGPAAEKGGARGPAREAPAARPGGPGGPGGGAPPANLKLAGIDGLWSQASAQTPSWRSITMRLPRSDRAPIAFTIDGGYGGQPQKRTTLTLNRAGTVESSESFADLNLGRRVRTWLRFVHTGEYYGLPGQTIAGVVSAGAVALVYTGIALSLRRLASWRSRRSRQYQGKAIKVA